MIASDHAPHTREEKEIGWTEMWSAHTGTPGIQYYYPLLLDAVTKGNLTLERAVESAALRPAQAFGLSKTKGQIAVGLDADLVIADMGDPWVISNDGVLSRCGWTPYDGRTCNVRIDRTFVRGNVVYADNKVVGEPGFGAMATADSTS
jgi:dihydroorotase-like cyclic amidohydrolase